ncbi:MAG TPA: 50S ribosomal protein L5 [bacterium]|nr:50S ribosomal protein L5 [bacterium]
MEKLAVKFAKEILPEIKKELSKKNVHEIPTIEKIVVSIGVGDYKDDDKMVDRIAGELAKITGQKPKLNLSRKAVSAFKLRIGQPVGLTVTLRNERMYDFLDRLVNVALPRVRDFRGLSTHGFDQFGNYSLGLRDYTIFPEIKFEEIVTNFGLQVNVKTTAKNKDEALVLLSKVGFPFAKKLEK